MKPSRLLAAALLVIAIGVVIMIWSRGEETQMISTVDQLSDEGRLPMFTGATTWINSPPLTADALHGKVVLVDFWTYTCINWLRTFPYVQAWAEKYRDRGLVVIGVHTPEFGFEHNLDNVRREVAKLKVDYPVAVDNDYAVWDAFANHYWPALYIIDAQGRIRYHHFGEGDYEQSERVLQLLLADAGSNSARGELVSVTPQGAEVAADFANLQSPETYVGTDRADNFVSPGGAVAGKPHAYSLPDRLAQNQWALSSVWTVSGKSAVLNEANGQIMFKFHARDLNLVMGPVVPGTSVRFRVMIEGHAPGTAHGVDTDDQGNGTLSEQGLYQLIRQSGDIADREFKIEFLDSGADVYSFTFG